MARKELYTLRTQPSSNGVDYWLLLKCDLDFNPTGTYLVSRSGTVLGCDCFASNKPTCRHRQMIAEFEVENRFNTHWWYEFDRKRWVEGPKG